MAHEIEFICSNHLQNCIPEPQLSYQNIPNWYVETPKISFSKCPFNFLHDNSVVRNVNIKGCPAVTDFLKYGYIIPAWTNFLFREIDKSFYVNWENSLESTYHFHGFNQIQGMTEQEKPVYGGFHKIASPWYIKTSPGISCILSHPHWTRENRFTSVSAIVHPDLCPMQIQWFFEWNYKLDENEIDYQFQTVKKGDPLILILPFKRDKYKLNIKYETEEKMNNLKNQVVHQSKDWFGNSLYSAGRKKIGSLFIK